MNGADDVSDAPDRFRQMKESLGAIMLSERLRIFFVPLVSPPAAQAPLIWLSTQQVPRLAC